MPYVEAQHNLSRDGVGRSGIRVDDACGREAVVCLGDGVGRDDDLGCAEHGVGSCKERCGSGVTLATGHGDGVPADCLSARDDTDLA